MVKRNLILLLLAFLASLQGLAPLLHAHPGGSPSDAPHLHVSVGATGGVGAPLHTPTLGGHDQRIVDAADGLARDDTPIDVAGAVLPAIALPIPISACAVIPLTHEASRARLALCPKPPAQAPPRLA